MHSRPTRRRIPTRSTFLGLIPPERASLAAHTGASRSFSALDSALLVGLADERISP